MRWRRSIILGLIGLLLAGLIWRITLHQLRQVQPTESQEENRTIPVSILRVKPGVLTETITLYGTLQFGREIAVVPMTSGRIVAMLAKIGDRVKEGQVLARLDNPSLLSALEQAQAGYQAASARWSQAQSSLPVRLSELEAKVAEAQEGLRSAQEALKQAEIGARLETTEAKAHLKKAQSGLASAQANLERLRQGARPEELRSVEAKLRQARLAYEVAHQTAQRLRKLWESGDIPRFQWEEAQAKADSAYQDLIAAEAQYEATRKGATPEEIRLAEEEVRRAEADLEIAQEGMKRAQLARSRVESARAQVKLAQAGLKSALAARRQAKALLAEVWAASADRERARGALKAAQTGRDALLVRAPADGIITQVHASVGETVSPESPLFTLSTTGKPLLRASIPEHLFPKIHRGQRVSLFSSLSPQRKYWGRIHRIVPALDPNTRRSQAEILINEDIRELPPGTYLQADLRVTTDRGLLIPRKALYESNGQPYVLVVEKGRAVQKKIRTGLSNALYIVVKSGLQPKDPVIISSLSFLQAGDRVRVIQEEKMREEAL